MRASDFIKMYSLRLANENDLTVYQQFFKKNSMATSLFNINLIRTSSLQKSFAEQGIQAFPLFLIDDKNQVCGFFSLGVRKAYLNGHLVSYGYLSDLRLSTQKLNRSLVDFRKIYRDILAKAKQIEEFKDIQFFLTSILGDNESALKALSRGRSDVVYRFLETIKTQALWIHPGYLIRNQNKFHVTIDECDNHLNVSQDGLSEDQQNINNVSKIKINVTAKGKTVFSAFLAEPSLRKLELGFNKFDNFQALLSMNWLLNTEIDSNLSDSDYKNCINAVVISLLKAKKINVSSFLLFKTKTTMPSVFLGKEMTSQIFEVGLKDQNFKVLDNQKVHLEPFFL